jgi:hypothetical protein
LVWIVVRELTPPVVASETEPSVSGEALMVTVSAGVLTIPPVTVAVTVVVPIETPVAKPELLIVKSPLLALHPVTTLPWVSSVLQGVVEPSE